MTQRKIALSIEEAADYTGIGRNTLRQLVEWKKLPVLKVGRKVLIKTDILEMFMEANEGRDFQSFNHGAIVKKSPYEQMGMPEDSRVTMDNFTTDNLRMKWKRSTFPIVQICTYIQGKPGSHLRRILQIDANGSIL